MNRVKPIRFENSIESERVEESEDDGSFKESFEYQSFEKLEHKRGSIYSLLGFIGLFLSIVILGSVYEMYMEFQKIFEFNTIFGTIYISLVAILVLLIFRFILKQRSSLRAIKKVAKFQERGEYLKVNPSKRLFKYLRDIIKEYESRVEVRENIQKVKDKLNDSELEDNVLDDIDFILEPLDKSIDKIILDTSKRNALLTAISPIAFVDMLILTINNYKMVVDIFKIYGFKPSFIGNMVIFKRVLQNLLFAGVSELGSESISEILGQSALSKISYATSQGLVNAIFTVKIGISAKELSRPMRIDNSGSLKWILSILTNKSS